ncbi:MAG: FAD-dependent oxidoreductase, partial [Cyanobacteria bacterium J06638_6]
MAYDFDLFVIGGGSGGIAAACRAASYGTQVGLAEADRLGGTCVNRGCVPKKLMVYASRFPEQFEAAPGFGWACGQRQFHWPTLVAAIDQEVDRLNNIHREMLDDAGVQVFCDHARFVDPHTLTVGDTTVTAAKILIAVGGRPVRPDNIPGIEHAITSDDIFHLPRQPQRIVIIGGGYIGSEFACILHGLGTEVTQLIRAETILRGFDEDLRQEIHGAMEQRGIQIIANTEQIAIAKTDSGIEVSVKTANDQITLPTDGVSLAATGRQPNLKNLGLENTGVEVKDGAIVVDPYHRTTVPHILAVGDVIARLSLTPVAIQAGRLVADTEFGQGSHLMDYDT